MIILTPQQLDFLAGNVITLCACWKIIRKDGFSIHVTDHDEVVEFNGIRYGPMLSFSASARQRQAGLKERNMEVVGVVEADAITDTDLRAGKYREAVVVEDLINWRDPLMGSFRRDYYWVKDIVYSGEEWLVKLTGASSFLDNRVGRTINRTCSWRFGEPNTCKVDASLMAASGTVLASNPKRNTFTSDATGEVDGYFSHGELEFTSGANSGTRHEVWSYNGATGQFILKLDTPFDIAPGDTFTVTPGCGGTIEECKAKFNNVINFGGFPFVPGTDGMLETPPNTDPVVD